MRPRRTYAAWHCEIRKNIPISIMPKMTGGNRRVPKRAINAGGMAELTTGLAVTLTHPSLR
jgi:hypothetical protein